MSAIAGDLHWFDKIAMGLGRHRPDRRHFLARALGGLAALALSPSLARAASPGLVFRKASRRATKIMLADQRGLENYALLLAAKKQRGLKRKGRPRAYQVLRDGEVVGEMLETKFRGRVRSGGSASSVPQASRARRRLINEVVRQTWIRFQLNAEVQSDVIDIKQKAERTVGFVDRVVDGEIIATRVAPSNLAESCAEICSAPTRDRSRVGCEALAILERIANCATGRVARCAIDGALSGSVICDVLDAQCDTAVCRLPTGRCAADLAGNAVLDCGQDTPGTSFAQCCPGLVGWQCCERGGCCPSPNTICVAAPGGSACRLVSA